MKSMVAVIGATGNVGSEFAFSLAAAGYRILFSDEIEKHSFLYLKLFLLEWKIRLRVPQADVQIVPCVREASWEADLIIPAISCAALADVASKIKDVVTGKIVISITSPLISGYDVFSSDSTTSSAENLATLLPHSKVVSVCNGIVERSFTKARMGGHSTDVFVSGDDEEAVSTVMQLVRDMGFNPICTGAHAMSRTLENMMMPQNDISASQQSLRDNWLRGVS
jgi:predicted dinucleotide-binding enzyme